MAEYFKEPQNPLKKIDETTGDITYVYPMTTAKQVIMDDDGTRLNTILNGGIAYYDANGNFFKDKDMTIPLYPQTKVGAVSDDNGVGLDVLLANITPDEIPAENVKMANGYNLELTLNGIWFDFTDADGNPTDEPHAHWLVDEETGEIATAGYLIAEEAEF